MYKNNSVIEAILLPKTKDFGLFQQFVDISKHCGLSDVKSIDTKNKSIVISGNNLYVCQSVKFKYSPMISELIIVCNTKTGDCQLAKTIPDTTRYRIASEYLWLYLAGVFNCVDQDSTYSILNNSIIDNSEVNIHYNDVFMDYYRTNGEQASLAEITLALSYEFQTKKK